MLKMNYNLFSNRGFIRKFAMDKTKFTYMYSELIMIAPGGS